MSELWEEAVETYLTTNRAVLVSRQYPITDERDPEKYPDLLAVDFRARQVWVVEVSAAWNTSKITNRAMQFKPEILPHLMNQLAEFDIVPDASGWNFGLWAFVREDVTQKVRDNIAPHVDLVRVEALEDTAFPWRYWEERRAEENVPRPKARSAAASSSKN